MIIHKLHKIEVRIIHIFNKTKIIHIDVILEIIHLIIQLITFHEMMRSIIIKIINDFVKAEDFDQYKSTR